MIFTPGDDVLHLWRRCEGWRFKERSALVNGILYATQYSPGYHSRNEWSFDRYHWGKASEDEDYSKHLWHVWDNILDQLVYILWNDCIPLYVHHLHLLVCHCTGLAHCELCHLLHHPCIRIYSDFIAGDLAKRPGWSPQVVREVSPRCSNNGNDSNLLRFYALSFGRQKKHGTIAQLFWEL